MRTRGGEKEWMRRRGRRIGERRRRLIEFHLFQPLQTRRRRGGGEEEERNPYLLAGRFGAVGTGDSSVLLLLLSTPLIFLLMSGWNR
jgi:hypothetical protein